MSQQRNRPVCGRLEALEPRRHLTSAAQFTGNLHEMVASFPTGFTLEEPVAAGNLLFFRGGDVNSGTELWKSDGTAAGTVRVADINPGPASGHPKEITPLGSKVVFRADDGIHGLALWVSDGTAEGTKLIADFSSNPNFIAPPLLLTAINDRVFFNANDGIHGSEPWVTDGTSEGTRLLKDCFPGPDGSEPVEFVGVGEGVFFLGLGQDEIILWKSDLTEAGTEPLATLHDVRPPGTSYIDFRLQLTALGEKVVFKVLDFTDSSAKLYVSDGTAGGTQALATIGPFEYESTDRPASFTVVGSDLFFIGATPSTGHELWKSDGTVEGTGLVRDIRPGPADSGLYLPGQEVRADKLMFGANDGVTGPELWTSNGTSDGTVLLREFKEGLSGISPGPFAQVGETMLFGTSLHGIGRSDGTAHHTVLQSVTSNSSVISFRYTIQKTNFSALNGYLYFFVNRELWRVSSDDTTPPTPLSNRLRLSQKAAVEIVFSEDITTTFPMRAEIVENLTTGQTLAPDQYQILLAGQPQFNVARLEFNGIAPPITADGNYRLTLPGGTVRDAFDNVQLAPSYYDFFLLAGDANRDRFVNVFDFTRLASAFGSSSLRTYEFGNFDGLAGVDLDDFTILASQFGKSLPAMPQRAANAVAAPHAPVFATPRLRSGRIDRDRILDLIDAPPAP